MAVRTRTRSAVQLGNLELGRRRHICAVFEDSEDLRSALARFTLDCIGRGEQVVHLVEDPAADIAAIRAEARASGVDVDVDAAIDAGRLDVRPWSAAYLDGGFFSETRQLAYIGRWLRASATLDVPARRLIGDMTWATSAVPGVDQLVAYEYELNRITGRPGVTVICAYDASRHSRDTIEAILFAHDAAAVSAGERAAGYRALGATARGATVRRRILDAAAALFGEQGVRATGVDTLIEAANVAKATFYRQFPSKEALVVAWLQDRGTRWFDEVRKVAEAGATSPFEVIPRIFDATANWLAATDFLGCPYLNTAFELSAPDLAASQVSRAYIAEIGAYFEEQALATGRPDASDLALALHGLLAGSISLAVATRTTVHAVAAREAASRLLASLPD